MKLWLFVATAVAHKRGDDVGDAVSEAVDDTFEGMEHAGDQPWWQESSMTANSVPASGSDYREGFQGKVRAKPNLPAQLRGESKSLTYEDSKLRAAVRAAVDSVLATEQPIITAKIRAFATESGKTQSDALVLTNAKQSAVQAFEVTSKLLCDKAKETCKSISNLENLPQQCCVEAVAEFQKILPLAVGKWSQDEVAAVGGKTAQLAGDEAYDAVKDVALVNVPPQAFNKARDLYAIEFDKLKKAYDAKVEKEILDLDTWKTKFWDDARKDMVAKVDVAVKTAVNDVPVKKANAIMERQAKMTANSVSTKLVAAHLAPKFANAAKLVLKTAVKNAHEKVMVTFKANWDTAGASK
mmetsp:Transcript_52883/g.116068  ORF Transcript_52883/g.116068 Transcript_52883/m.116068 type:complete len:354 (+) Transcript_52883:124-1185(+)|eukprot:CAMPEP_0204253218 /NCGR_PEP_ID=MMETSP0468-20130131/1749_1 /ASSEMBLY_ACC=CAM_ASM_000383 /TAXON_ID=2969 /ORGANISM="Oxyrrhis marina" /LENGTH=353 /DNA_ID=CAMNT_0051226765 /DNA_START=67 /DNA_END=1128 /DNA_ORIENTATION=-